MDKKRNINMKGTGNIQRMLAGIAGSILTTMAATAISAVMISRKLIPEEKMDYCAVAVLLASSITGVGVAINGCDNRIIPGVCVACTYLLMLMVLTAIFFGAQYQQIGVTIIIVLIGCILAGMLCKKGVKNHKIRKSKIKRC